MTTYDVIVIGTGGMGSAAAYHLARRGARVLGLDRFSGAHDRGSSHGHTRVIRHAYFEHPDYVPLLSRAYDLWRELEKQAGETLYHEVGLLQVGPRDGAIVPSVRQSAQQHNLELEEVSREDLAARFSGFVVPDGYDVVFERRAGYLLVERCVMAHLQQATRAGAEFRTEAVRRWNASGPGVTVETDSASYSAGRLIIAAGAWAGSMLADLGIELRVLLKHLHWYPGSDTRYRRDTGAPTFFYEVPGGYYYGFPQLDERGVKVAEHSGGTEVVDPLTAPRVVDPKDRARVESFLAQMLPGVSSSPAAHTTCFYTMSRDEHFIIDRHPEHEQVSFVAGLSGHGFKFACVLGEVLAGLALDGKTGHAIEFLSCQRPGVRGDA